LVLPGWLRGVSGSADNVSAFQNGIGERSYSLLFIYIVFIHSNLIPGGKTFPNISSLREDEK
jgi:hypothetical protein